MFLPPGGVASGGGASALGAVLGADVASGAGGGVAGGAAVPPQATATAVHTAHTEIDEATAANRSTVVMMSRSLHSRESKPTREYRASRAPPRRGSDVCGDETRLLLRGLLRRRAGCACGGGVGRGSRWGRRVRGHYGGFESCGFRARGGGGGYRRGCFGRSRRFGWSFGARDFSRHRRGGSNGWR